MIHPPEFIPAGQKNGLIIPLGEQILKLVCRNLVAWRETGLPPPLRVALNISARQFRQDNLPNWFGTLEETGLSGDRLEFELTGMVMHDVETPSPCCAN